MSIDGRLMQCFELVMGTWASLSFFLIYIIYIQFLFVEIIQNDVECDKK